ncbi:hypothetical protein GCM10009413_14060 [Tatumella punctata]
MVSHSGNTLMCSAPGTSHQAAPDFTRQAAAYFIMEPAGLLLHRWQAGEDMVTHYLPAGNYDRPGP